MGTPSLVLFDLDETLFDHRHASRIALSDLRDRHSVLREVSLDDLEERAREILDRVHDALLGGRVSPSEARLERLRSLLAEFGPVPSDALLDRTASEYGVVYRRARRAVPGAVDLLERLRGVPGVRRLGVVTNHIAEVQREKLDACGLTDLVDFMVTSEEVGHRKPAPQVFEEALARAGAKPEETVMVGDSWEGDVRGAAAVGMRAVWFNPGGVPRPSLADPEVPELESFQPPDTACQVILSA